jgi:hypothetical protein
MVPSDRNTTTSCPFPYLPPEIRNNVQKERISGTVPETSKESSGYSELVEISGLNVCDRDL